MAIVISGPSMNPAPYHSVWVKLHSIEAVAALFAFAEIPVLGITQVPNQYWPESPRYDSVRTPWWNVQTKHGIILIGWRKRVLNIDWSKTPIRMTITDDDVTKSVDAVHAYNIGKALTYLSTLSAALYDYKPVTNQPA